MRGKCESCEFYVVSTDTESDRVPDGGCHIRSVERWPKRPKDDGCGEHQEREEEFPVTTVKYMEGVMGWLEEEEELACRINLGRDSVLSKFR